MDEVPLPNVPVKDDAMPVNRQVVIESAIVN